MRFNEATEEVQLSAIKGSASNIKYIQNPTEKVQLAAVKKSEYNIDLVWTDAPNGKSLKWTSSSSKRKK